MPFEQILLPVDGDPHEEVITQAVRLADGADATIHALYVVDERLFPDPRPVYYDEFSDSATDELKSYYESVGEKALESVETLLSENESESDLETTIESGVPNEVICRYATENDIEAIVMATHTRMASQEEPLGSVTERVIRAARTPIFVIPPHVTDEE